MLISSNTIQANLAYSVALTSPTVAQFGAGGGIWIDAASSVNITNNNQILSNIEKDARKIKATELTAMATLYGRGLGYFLDDKPSSDPSPLWRKKTEAKTTKVQREFLVYIENYSKMESLLGLKLKRKWKDVQKNYDKRDFQEQGHSLAYKIAKHNAPQTSLAIL